MKHLFTSESVSEGHPDKMADQISDALLDNYLAFDKTSKDACEPLVTTGQVVVAGEIKTNSIIDHDKIIRNVIDKIVWDYNSAKYDVAGNPSISKDELISQYKKHKKTWQNT